MMNELTAVSPIDGRYHSKTASLSDFFSEAALMRYRVQVEVEYYIALCESGLPQLKDFAPQEFSKLRKLYQEFSINDAKRIKEIESVTNHDVKAIEYFIKEKMVEVDESYKDFVHFGLTSQDINNTAFPMMIRDALTTQYIPLLTSLIEKLKAQSEEWSSVSMLARTHGQPASPTRLGKELEVFVYRLEVQLEKLLSEVTNISGKFGGATGNFNAHHVAYPNIDWVAFANQFLKEKLHIIREQKTTQISNYDNFAALFDALQRIHTIIIDLDRDIWMYISLGYFKQKIKKGEVGSSAMPHKVNPIDFENSEGNMAIANSILHFLSAKLPISRLQRDLTDSTVLRNIGVPVGHAMIAMQSTLKGLNKLMLNADCISQDLENCWAVVAEAIQTVLRREGYPNPYEALKQLTRTNGVVNETTIHEFINTLDVSNTIKEELKRITPQNYVGL